MRQSGGAGAGRGEATVTTTSGGATIGYEAERARDAERSAAALA